MAKLPPQSITSSHLLEKIMLAVTSGYIASLDPAEEATLAETMSKERLHGANAQTICDISEGIFFEFTNRLEKFI